MQLSQMCMAVCGVVSVMCIQDADEHRSPGSSSAEALSSGLRTAVRQLGSSYRLGSAAAPDIPIRAQSPHGPAKRHEVQRLAGMVGSQSCQSPEQHASSSEGVYELSDSEGMHVQPCCMLPHLSRSQPHLQHHL